MVDPNNPKESALIAPIWTYALLESELTRLAESIWVKELWVRDRIEFADRCLISARFKDGGYVNVYGCVQPKAGWLKLLKMRDEASKFCHVEFIDQDEERIDYVGRWFKFYVK